MNGRGMFSKAFGEMSTVMNNNRAGLCHAQVEIIQRIQQGWIFRPIPQNSGFMLIEPIVFSQGLGIPGPQLTDGTV